MNTFVFCNDGNIIATIKNKVITKQDFIKRAEYTLRPNYCKSDNNIHKKIILNSLIAEKIMAIDIEPYVDKNNFSSNFLEGIKEQKMREVYLNDMVYSNIKLDSNIVSTHFNNSTKVYEFNYISFSNDSLLADIQYLLNSGETFDNICYNYLMLSEIPYRKVDYNNESDPAIFNEIFSKKIEKNEIFGPIISKDKKILFLKVIDWVDTPIITTKEKEEQYRLVYQRLYEIEQIKAYDNFILDLMSGYKVKFIEKPFFKLADKAYEFYISKENLKSNQDGNLNFLNQDDIRFDEPLLKFDKEILTINDINNLILKHPLLFRKQNISYHEFPLYFKYAIVDLIRDEQISKIAYLNDYDKHKDVIKEYDLFKDATLSNLHVKAVLERNAISIDTFNNNHKDMLDDIFNEYIKSLQQKYSDEIKINFDILDEVSLTHIDLYAYKKGVPYPMLVPLFPILTTNHTIDYGTPLDF